MTEDFVRERITQLRIRKGVSEYQMSYDLGHSLSYIYNFSSGRALPPLNELFAICEYFDLSPSEFFDDSTQVPELVKQICSEIKSFNEHDLNLLLALIKRIKE